MNDNRPTEQQPKENKQPTIRDLENRIYEHSILAYEVLTFTRLVQEHFESGFNVSNEESLHCFSMLNRNIRELISGYYDLQDLMLEMRYLDDKPKNETH